MPDRGDPEGEDDSAMIYDPFQRGPFPAGVRTVRAVDTTREDRPLPVEIWYPATDDHAGKDLATSSQDRWTQWGQAFSQDAVRDADARAGSYPLIAFSHGSGGQRRQSTFLCTHLASHGYVVAAVDHTGNTVDDMIVAASGTAPGDRPSDSATMVRGWIAARPADVRFMIDGVLDGSVGDVAAHVAADRIGMVGHSFGGWAALKVTAHDHRIRA